jgi:hypothetical protein
VPGVGAQGGSLLKYANTEWMINQACWLISSRIIYASMGLILPKSQTRGSQNATEMEGIISLK